MLLNRTLMNLILFFNISLDYGPGSAVVGCGCGNREGTDTALGDPSSCGRDDKKWRTEQRVFCQGSQEQGQEQ